MIGSKLKKQSDLSLLDPSKTAGDPSKTAGDPSKTAGDPSKTAGDPSKTAGDPRAKCMPLKLEDLIFILNQRICK